MKTRLLGGIAALLVAIIGTVLLVSYVQNADKRALAGTETESIYIVQKAIPAGTAADKIAAMVTKKEVPKLALADSSVTDLASLGTKVTAVTPQFSDGAATQTGTSDTASGASQVSSTSSTKAQGDGSYLITLARNSADAERIVFATEFGKVYLSKEPGNAVESGKGTVDAAGLFR
ncbi:hypothetical protein AB4Y88_20345 [Paenarthrobacter sp. RAF9]